MVQYEFFLASSLKKVFPHRRPEPLPPNASVSCWRGCKAAVQLVYTARNGAPNMPVQQYRVTVLGAPGSVRIRRVELMPSQLPCYENADDDYISKQPGLFPDLLADMTSEEVLPLPRQYRSLWLTFEIPEDAPAGGYGITVQAEPCRHRRQPNGTVFHDPDADSQVFRLSFTLRISRAELPPQRLLHTQWFHTDCLANYYGFPVFSEEYWRVTENFIRAAAEHGVNMLLTPVFTPPLDTPVGGERPTVQLVDLAVEKGIWRFGFEKLRRWTVLCKKHGITHLEIPHLFTQWGAAATPKILAEVDGVRKQVFGWEVPADSPAYRVFLRQFLPALREELGALGFDREHVYFHISDEPSEENMDAFLTAQRQTRGLLEDCPVFDALTSFAFYKKGLVRTPVVANDHIQPFFEAGVPNLWVYYCCVQGDRVPNRFFAMESARNRIMGVLMYLYRVSGFLHWGFNFYNAKFSIHAIDPFRTTDGQAGYPSGDPFLVYPGKDGQPLSSIRAEVQDDALLDLRALQLLEDLTDRDTVTGLILKIAGMERITFRDYPRGSGFLLTLRERVAAEIESCLQKTSIAD